MASEWKHPMSSSSFNFQSTGVLVENGEGSIQMWMISLCKRLGEVEFPPCSLGKRWQTYLLYATGSAEILYRRWRWWLAGFFFLQQTGSGIRCTKGNSLLFSSSFQIALEKGKTGQDRWDSRSWECLCGLLADVSWIIVSFPLSARGEMLDGDKKRAG